MSKAFRVSAWIAYYVGAIFALLIAWPVLKLTGKNIVMQKEAPFRWMQWIEENL